MKADFRQTIAQVCADVIVSKIENTKPDDLRTVKGRFLSKADTSREITQNESEEIFAKLSDAGSSRMRVMWIMRHPFGEKTI